MAFEDGIEDKFEEFKRELGIDAERKPNPIYEALKDIFEREEEAEQAS